MPRELALQSLYLLLLTCYEVGRFELDDLRRFVHASFGGVLPVPSPNDTSTLDLYSSRWAK